MKDFESLGSQNISKTSKHFRRDFFKLYKNYYLMSGVVRQIMRTVIAVMLFQFIAPTFLPTTEARLGHTLQYETDHNSVFAPQFLKETDESSLEKFSKGGCISILNLTSHFFSITTLHDKRSYFLYDHQDPSAPASLLFKIHRTFRI